PRLERDGKKTPARCRRYHLRCGRGGRQGAAGEIASMDLAAVQIDGDTRRVSRSQLERSEESHVAHQKFLPEVDRERRLSETRSIEARLLARSKPERSGPLLPSGIIESGIGPPRRRRASSSEMTPDAALLHQGDLRGADSELHSTHHLRLAVRHPHLR